MIDKNKSLQELEGEYWGTPDFPSHLVRTIHHLRTLPLRELTVEHLRMAIGQKMSLILLIPMALELLEKDPLVSDDFYPGDLLRNVLRVIGQESKPSVEVEQRVKSICIAALEKLNSEEYLDQEMTDLVSAFLLD